MLRIDLTGVGAGAGGGGASLSSSESSIKFMPNSSQVFFIISWESLG